MTLTIDAAGIYYRQLNETIRQAVAGGERHLKIINVRGQRYLGAGLTNSDLLMEIEGVPGDDLAFCLGGPTLVVRGPGQNAVANTMDSGRVIVHGLGGDALAYGMRGGQLFVRDNVGYRVGIHMKEYQDRSPSLVIGGTTGDFLGEYMAGGTIVVLNRHNEKENVGGLADQTLATGIHGGQIYIYNYDVPSYMPGIGATVSEATAEEKRLVEPLVREYCHHFAVAAEPLLERELVRIAPAGSRPFSRFYYPAYPVNTGLIPEQQEMASPCQAACPVGIPTGRYLGHLRHGEYKEALDLIDSYTPFRHSNCGFICTHRCMEACSRGKVDFSVRTSDLARNLYNTHVVKKEGTFEGKVAIIGAGPSGLSSAYFLSRLGYVVNIYEAGPRAGGKMDQVISRRRLPLEHLQRDLDNIAGLGMSFHFDVRVDEALFAKLLAENDHVIVAVGAQSPILPGVKGSEHIRPGLDFLKAHNLGEEITIGPRAVLIGGGDAAMDGIEALVQLGIPAEKITVIDIQTPSADKKELSRWINSGVNLLYPYYLQEVTPEGVLVKDISGANHFVPGDTIAFINEAPRLDFLPQSLRKELDRKGFYVAEDKSGATSDPRVSVTGDALGLGLVAHSIRKGRECAERVHAALQGLEYEPTEAEAIDVFDLHLGRRSPGSEENALAIDEEHERCLHCGVCVRCDECVEACPREARHREDKDFTVDKDKCGGCGTCAAACKGGVVRMVPR